MQVEERGLCLLSIVPVRAEGKESSELVTQLLFGDLYSIIDSSEDGEWLKIEIQFDGYIGWINHKQHHAVSAEHFEELSRQEFPFCGEISAVVQIEDESHYIVFGSLLPLIEKNPIEHAQQMKFDGKKAAVRKNSDFAILKELAFQYLNTPYLWGGKTPFGIDCSGFVQMVFKLGGYSLKRDASQQALQGKEVPNVADALPGDLAFFQNTAGKIVHVGIVLENQQIIHASGKVRVDFLDEKGIFIQKNKLYTHSLCSIKRLIM